MTLSTQFPTTLSNAREIMGGGYFSSAEQTPIAPKTTMMPLESMMTPLQAVFAHETKRSRQDDDGRPSSKRVRRGPSRRIPCKARGITSDSHNMDTAFFDVPADAPHGMLLCCSHPECAASGRRFRFCSVCEMPFAKRNFLKRHGHGMVHSSKELNEDDVENMLCQVISTSSPTPAPRRLHKRVVSFDGNNSKRRSLITENNADDDNSNNNSAGAIINETMVNENEQHWLELLNQRPETQDQKEMTAWMDKVIDFSDVSSSQRSGSKPRSVVAPPSTRIVTPPAAQVSPMVTSIPSTTWDATAIGDALTSPLETEPTEELVAFMDDCDFSTVFEDDKHSTKGIEKVGRNAFWPVSV